MNKERTTVEVIDVPEDTARYIMCKEHEYRPFGSDYNMISLSGYYAAKCRHCGKVVTNTKPHYDFDFTLGGKPDES